MRTQGEFDQGSTLLYSLFSQRNARMAPRNLVLWSSLECSPPCQGGGRGFKSRQDRSEERGLAPRKGRGPFLVTSDRAPSPPRQGGGRACGSAAIRHSKSRQDRSE
ncbi:putative serine/threonine protein kinase [Streptomyces azureus]|uniref:Putative serine/threonine protein kinase n=1 Tax=Streptomyces azureus TaxID=146537 RepID=A0A0K8PR26_STRAJ|nr:putative serine/threonine protein kinase [Streptomyces azureus]